jgi:methylenetetrahydrofolate reductase (NADPH)
MKISDKLQHLHQTGKTSISFEFFPPKSQEGYNHLFNVIHDLQRLKPAFVSITYGAGGSTQQRTRELSGRVNNEIGLDTMAHLTCVGSDRRQLQEILEQHKDNNITNILALRGDPPKDSAEFVPPENGFAHADELVHFVQKQFPQRFDVGVAFYPEGHPESPDLATDLFYFRQKVDAGARFAISQLFLDNRFYFDYLEHSRSRGIHIPLIAGIMPVTDLDQIKKFTQMIGASIPKKLLARLEQAHKQGGKEEVKKIGIDYATRQCQELLEQGVEGIHFYTLNRSLPTITIFNNLSL